MDVSTGGVSCDSGKLVRGGGAPRAPGPRVYQIQGVKNDFSMGGRRAARGAAARAGVGGAATWAERAQSPLQPWPGARVRAGRRDSGVWDAHGVRGERLDGSRVRCGVRGARDGLAAGQHARAGPAAAGRAAGAAGEE